MSASDEGGSSANAIVYGAEAVEGIARSLTLPRALIDANLRAGSALLGFAGQCVTPRPSSSNNCSDAAASNRLRPFMPALSRR